MFIGIFCDLARICLWLLDLLTRIDTGRENVVASLREMADERLLSFDKVITLCLTAEFSHP